VVGLHRLSVADSGLSELRPAGRKPGPTAAWTLGMLASGPRSVGSPCTGSYTIGRCNALGRQYTRVLGAV